MSEYETLTKYDRVRAGLQGVSLFTKPSTVKNVQFVTGKTETFVVETSRHDELGDHIFIEAIDETGTIRLALPPKVADLIAAQRDRLGTKRRKIAGKRRAANDKAAGVVPGFMRGKAKEK